MIKNNKPIENMIDATNPGVGNDFGVCECCRRKRYLTRHHVVPYAFSRHFDQTVFPDNRMMLCRPCHDIVEIELKKFRKFFRGRLGITQDDLRQSDEHIRYKKAKAYAWQLVSNYTNIPTSKIMEMTVYIHCLYPNATTFEDFRSIARDESKINETRTHPYGKLVADKIKELGMEEWFWKVWKARNKRIIAKLRAKGVDKEKERKRRVRHLAPESDSMGVIVMLVNGDDKMSAEQAEEFYSSQTSDMKLTLRRCAYAWAKKRAKVEGISDEASKEKTCEYISSTSHVSLETASEIYRLSSKRKKKSLRKRAFEYFLDKE